MTSFVSMCILLLVTYSYSLPIEHLYVTSTIDYQITANIDTTHHENEVLLQLASDEKSTEVQTNHDHLSFDQIPNEESTTPDPYEYPEDVSIPSTTSDEYLFTSSSIISTIEPLSSNNIDDKHTSNDDLLTTAESKLEFNQEIVTTTESIQNEVESSTVLNVGFLPDDDNDAIRNLTLIEASLTELVSSTSEDLSIIDSERQESDSLSLTQTDNENLSLIESESEISTSLAIEIPESETFSSFSSSNEPNSDVSSYIEPQTEVSIIKETDSYAPVGSLNEQLESKDFSSVEIDLARSESLTESAKSIENLNEDQVEEKPIIDDDDKIAQLNEDSDITTTIDLIKSDQLDSNVDEDESDD